MSNLIRLELPSQSLNSLFGVQDQNIKYLESLLGISIGVRGNEVMVDGDAHDVQTARQILSDFAQLFDEGNRFTDKELQDAFSKRLDEITKQLDAIERQQRILIESLALFIRYHLGMIPPLPEDQQAAAHALGTQRYRVFINQVSRLLAGGKNTGAEILELLK